MPTGSKDTWDKIAVLGTVLAGLLIPLAIAVVGNAVSRSIKESENQVKYLEMATSILRESPKPETAALRGWAVDLISNYSKDVPLSTAAQAELKAHDVPIYSSGSWGTTVPSTVWGTSPNPKQSSSPEPSQLK